MIYETIQQFAQKNNILIGICDNSILPYNKNKQIPFVNFSLEERTNPLLAFEKTKSVIVAAIPYGKQFNFQSDNEIRGRISISAIGIDYHIIVRKILEKLMSELNNFQKTEYKIFVDNGPLIERELAKKSGIGYQGKNCSIITDKFGSFVFLGYALTDILLKPSNNMSCYNDYCGDCDLCIKACPTKAIGHFEIDAYKCVSYLTQTKAKIPFRLKTKMNNSIYGCDICQMVCPKNADKYISEIDDINIVMPKIEFLNSLSNREFKEIYGNTAMFWRGKKTILRNAEIARINLENNS